MTLTVDIHSHIYPGWFLDLFRSRAEAPRVVEGDDGDRFHLFVTQDGIGSGPLMTAEYTTVEEKLAFMDRHGIDRSIVSLGNPWLEVFDPEPSAGMAREANTRMAKLAEETSGRLYGMGVLPSGGPDTAAAIIEEVASEPGLRGVISSTTVCGLLFDDPDLEPVWEALAANRVPLLVHPMLAQLTPDLAGFGIALSAGVAFPYQTTVALGRLLLGGVLGRHPDLRIVASHGGGALPFLIGRLEGTHHGDPADEPLRDSARRLLLDAALYEPDTVRMAADLVGADHLLFGTDHPFPNADADRISRAIRLGLGEAETALVMGTAAAEWYDLPG